MALALDFVELMRFADQNKLPAQPTARGLSLWFAVCLASSGLADPDPAPALDPAFRPSFTATANVVLRAIVLQPDGRLLVAGRFDFFHGHPYNGLVRLDTHGAVDASFALWPGIQGTVNAVAVQPDGKILLGGDFVRVAGQVRHTLARLDADGSLDETFVSRVGGHPTPTIEVVRVQEDGRILIGGEFRMVGSTPRACLARLQPNGDLDETFDPGAAVEDGFGVVQDLAPLPDGGVVVAGLFTKFDGLACPGLVRLDAQGRVDSEFAPALYWSQGLVSVSLVRRQRDGRLLVAGRFDQLEGETRIGLARLQESGALDRDFEVGGGWGGVPDDAVRDLAVQPDGRIVLAGDFVQVGAALHRGITRVQANGAVDEEFDPGAGLLGRDGTTGHGNAIAIETDGRILVAGAFLQIGDVHRQHLARLLPNGGADSGYSNADGLVERVGAVNTIVVQADGRIVVGGDFERVQGEPRQALARILPHGTLDEPFNAHLIEGGIVNALALQPGGELIVGGRFAVHGRSQENLIRLTAEGHLDPTFDPNAGPNGEVYCLALEPDGHLVVGGQFDVVGGVARDRLARLDPFGVVDSGFVPRLSARVDTPDVYALAAQANGLVIIGGYFDAVNGESRTGLARLRHDGSVDLGFGGVDLIDGDLPIVTGLAFQGDGRLLVTGTFNLVAGEPWNGIARLGPEGELDRTFQPGTGVAGGELPTVYGVALEPGGQSVLVGEFETFAGEPRLNLARLNADGSLDPGFHPEGWMDWWALGGSGRCRRQHPHRRPIHHRRRPTPTGTREVPIRQRGAPVSLDQLRPEERHRRLGGAGHAAIQ